MTKPDTSSFRKILVFNTTERDQTSVAILVDGKTKKITAPVRAQDLQKLSAELLSLLKIKIQDIDAVAVLNGPGSYTGTRMGITAANTVGWLLDKPIIELDGDSLDIALKQLDNKLLTTVKQAKARY